MLKIGNCTLYCGDGPEILGGLRDIDSVITDPPYGVGLDYGDHYEDSRENLVELIGRFMPAAKQAAQRIAITCGTKNIWVYPEADWTLAWFMGHSMSRCKWGFSMWQPVLVYGKDPYLQNGMGGRPDTLYATTAGRWLENVDHPCAKPNIIMERIVNRVSVSGVICDPFMGSGTTALASLKLGRPFIGIEKSRKFFDVAVKRIEDFSRQNNLF